MTGEVRRQRREPERERETSGADAAAVARKDKGACSLSLSLSLSLAGRTPFKGVRQRKEAGKTADGVRLRGRKAGREARKRSHVPAAQSG